MKRGVTIGTVALGAMLVGDYAQHDTTLLKTVDSMFGKDVFDIYMNLPGQYIPWPR